MKFVRKHILSIIALVLIVGGVFAYVNRDSLFPEGSFTRSLFSTSTLTGIQKEIISGPLRSLQNSPNAHLTMAGTIKLTNAERTSRNLNALKESAILDKSAQIKLDDMFKRQYFEHVSPDGKGPAALADDVGYKYIVVGENLALGNYADDAALIKAWMDSPGHRANILHEDYQEIGVAVGKGMFEGHETWLAVQEFGKPASACPSIDAALKASIDKQQGDLDNEETQLQKKKAELDQEHPRTQAERDQYNQDVAEYNAEVKQYTINSDKLQADIATYNKQVRAFNECLGN